MYMHMYIKFCAKELEYARRARYAYVNVHKNMDDAKISFTRSCNWRCLAVVNHMVNLEEISMLV